MRRSQFELIAVTDVAPLPSPELESPPAPMSPHADGMTYAPQGKPNPVVGPGEFRFAAMGLEHGHIYGQCNGLIEAGGTLVKVWDRDAAKVADFHKRYPDVAIARDRREILEDPNIRLVVAAAIPNERGPLGCEVMRHGMDYFTDKCPFTTLEQLAMARRVVAETGRKYMVYYSERLHVECAVYAGDLVEQGAIGRVIQVIGLGPHRLSLASRPSWFFQKAFYGGILTDIGSHQVEQFLYYTGARDGRVLAAKVANYDHPEHPELEDFGDVTLVADNGATGYHRVDWFTPNGLRSWGDGRLFLLGTSGYLELRKYIDPAAADGTGDHVYLVNDEGERHLQVAGQIGFPFFGRLIRDVLDRSETAMTQAHAFKAAELSLQAQAQAIIVAERGGRPALK
jgi:predicted dehydrogenase